MNAQLQAKPTPVLYLPDELGPEIVPAGSHYNPMGRKSLFTLIPGHTYVWVGVGSESATHDGDPLVSGEPFQAVVVEILLLGDPDALVLASVKEVLR